MTENKINNKGEIMNSNSIIKKSIKKISVLGLLSALVIGSMSVSNTASAAKKKVDLNGTYHATLGIQTATKLWLARMAYYDDAQNKFYKTKKADMLTYTDPDTQKTETSTGTFNEVEIKGNGTYTVSITDADFKEETCISQLHVATDIPLNDKIKFSNVIVNVDNKDICTFDEGVMEDQDNYLTGGMVLLAFNHWRPELIETLEGLGAGESADNGWELLQGTGAESASITFTVSGFAYDNPDAVAATPTAAADTSSVSTGSDTQSADSNSNNGSVVVFIVIAIVVIVAVIVIVISNKSKKNKQ